MSGQWTGAAAVCINEKNEVLMVLQGREDEDKSWSIPSGGKEEFENYEECCKREVFEETGYVIEVKEKIYVKNHAVHYFMVEVCGGEAKIQDPDELIHDVAWKSAVEIADLALTYEEDRAFLMEIINGERLKALLLASPPKSKKDLMKLE